MSDPGRSMPDDSGLPQAGHHTTILRCIIYRPMRGTETSLPSYFAAAAMLSFLVLAVTGPLLQLNYEASARPVVDAEGRPLVALTLRADFHDPQSGWGALQGEVLFLPWSVEDSRPILPFDSLALVLDLPATGRPAYLPAAYQSVEYGISREMDFGTTIRAAHHYAAGFLIATLAGYLFLKLISLRRRPVDYGLWLMVVALFLLALAAAYTGSILPWSQLGLAAAEIGLSAVEETIPALGPLLADLLRGGPTVDAATLPRMYALHVTLLPLLLLPAVAIAVLCRQRKAEGNAVQVHSELRGSLTSLCLLVLLPLAGAITTGNFSADSLWVSLALAFLPPIGAHAAVALVSRSSKQASDTLVWWPDGALRFGVLAVLLFYTLIMMASLWPLPAASAGDIAADVSAAAVPSEQLRPAWYFLPVYQLFNILPLPIAGPLLIAAAGILILAPWSRKLPGALSTVCYWLSLGIVGGIIVLLCWGAYG